MKNQTVSIIEKMKSENHWCAFNKDKKPRDNSTLFFGKTIYPDIKQMSEF